MPAIPPDWKTLNVVRDLGISRSDGISPPSTLGIHRTQKGSDQIYARWLPDTEDDPRPRERDANGKLKKRIPYEQSMRTKDPLEAGHRAVRWWKELSKDLQARQDEKFYDSKHSLERYWNQWWIKEERRLLQKTNGSRRIKDEKAKWSASEWGVGSQAWSKKRIDLIDYKDLDEYWRLLDRRATTTNDMVGTKKQQKTLINKIFTEAMTDDMPQLKKLDFPKIVAGRSKSEVKHLRKEEWDLYLEYLVNLSGGLANTHLSPEQYQNTEWTQRNRKNPRNWIDLYDASLFLWFFYARATDLNVVTSEMLSIQKDADGHEKGFLTLEQDKSNRPILPTTHYRQGAIRFIERTKRRKPSGYLFFPHLIRPEGAPKDSHLLETTNFLLQSALSDIGVRNHQSFGMTELRHTAFRLTLEELPILGEHGRIKGFAENGHTSPEMLEKHYLSYIRIEKQAKDLMISEQGQWEMIKRVQFM